MLYGLMLSIVGSVTWGDLAPSKEPITWAMLAPAEAAPLTYAAAYEQALATGESLTVCVGQPQRIADQERDEARKCKRLFVAADQVEMLPSGVYVMVPGNGALWIVEERRTGIQRTKSGVQVGLWECGPGGCRFVSP